MIHLGFYWIFLKLGKQPRATICSVVVVNFARVVEYSLIVLKAQFFRPWNAADPYQCVDATNIWSFSHRMPNTARIQDSHCSAGGKVEEASNPKIMSDVWCEAWCFECSHFHSNPQSTNVFKLFPSTRHWYEHVWLSVKLQSYWQRQRARLLNSTSIVPRQSFQPSSRIHVLFEFHMLMQEQMFFLYVSRSETRTWLIAQERG